MVEGVAQDEVDFLDYLIGSPNTGLDMGAFIGTHALAFPQKVGGDGRYTLLHRGLLFSKS